MEIKIPKRAEDLRIRHFKAFKEWNEEGMDTMDKARLVAAFTNRNVRYISSIDINDFDKIYNHILSVLSKIKINTKPPEEIQLNGRTYSLIDPHKTSAGWHMDWGELVKNGGFDKDPVKCACLFYHPKGHGYGEVDRNSNLVHSIKDKYEIFNNEFPLSIFIESASFFLLKSIKSISISTEKKIWEIKATQVTKRILSICGRKS